MNNGSTFKYEAPWLEDNALQPETPEGEAAPPLRRVRRSFDDEVFHVPSARAQVQKKNFLVL